MLITATRSRRRDLEVAEKVSVIQGDALARRVEQGLTELMRREAGVRVNNGPTPYLENISVRGLGGGRVLLATDGQRTATAGGTHGGLLNVDLTSIKRIEVLRGPASALYGSRAIGGVVNIITRDPGDQLDPEAIIGGALSAGFSSLNNALRETGRVYGVLADRRLQYQLTLGRTDGFRLEDSNGDVVSAGYTATSVAAKLLYLVPRHRLTVDASYLHATPVLNDGVAGQPTETPGRVYLRDVTEKTIDTFRATLRYRYEPRSGHLAQLTGYLSGGRVVDRDDDDFLKAGRPQLFVRRSSAENQTTLVGLEPRYSFRVASRRAPQELTFGALVELERYAGEKAQTEWRYTRAGGPLEEQTKTRYALHPDTTFVSLAAYAQDELTLFGRLRVIAGLRYDHFLFTPDRETPGYDAAGMADDAFDTRSAWALSPKLSVTLRVLEGWALSAIVARGFRVSGAESRYYNFFHAAGGGFYIQGNPDLGPESSWNFELGTKGRLGKLWFSAAAFWLESSGFIDIRVSQDGSGTTIRRYENVDQVRLLGAELEVELRRLFGHLGVKANLTLMRGQQIDVPQLDADGDPTGTSADETYPTVPVFGTLTALWQQRHGRFSWQVMANLRFQGKQTRPAQRLDDPAPDGFVVLGASASAAWRDRYRLSVGVNNLLDARYQEPQNRLAFSAPRVFFVSAMARF